MSRSLRLDHGDSEGKKLLEGLAAMLIQNAIAPSLPMLSRFVSGAASAAMTLAPAVQSCFAHLPFCVYGAMTCVMALQAWLALREHKPDHAREHTLHSLAHAILALAHLLG